jgi:hypothetical protein
VGSVLVPEAAVNSGARRVPSLLCWLASSSSNRTFLNVSHIDAVEIDALEVSLVGAEALGVTLVSSLCVAGV